MNRLSKQTSPYLLQHQHNPVDWYAWGEEAFQAAQDQEKPIFLSIGYSTCYWCHVMEKDSFERDDVAELLNQNFICIKVDREERPDVDQIYMDAVVGLSGHGGWPLSTFLTPELKPFWGGTFFYRDRFVQVLSALAKAWREDREAILESGGKIATFLSEREELAAGKLDHPQASDDAVRHFSASFDHHYGGFGAAPKFPPATQISYLLCEAKRRDDKDPARLALGTLRAMALGGLFDQAGGGFHRYSVDERWAVPHFEKMLYDNALLVKSYLEAYQFSADGFYAEVAERSLNYLLAEMKNPEGGFFAAQDAGEVDREGEFYLWDFEQLKALLSAQEFTALQERFDITPEGNFEHGKIVLGNIAANTKAIPLSALQLAALTKLYSERSKRAAPHLDRKILAGWNGLALTALCRGYQVLGHNQYLEAAQQAANFIKRELYQPDNLLRSYCAGTASIKACLEDYAFLIEGLLELYQSDFDGAHLHWVLELQAELDRKLWDKEAAGYFFSAAPELLFKKKDLLDGATPAPNSTAINNLLVLDRVFPEHGFRAKAEQILNSYSLIFEKYPYAACKALIAFSHFVIGGTEIVIAPGGDRSALERDLRAIWGAFIANRVLALAPVNLGARRIFEDRKAIDGVNTFYVCKGLQCDAPTTNLDFLKKAS